MISPFESISDITLSTLTILIRLHSLLPSPLQGICLNWRLCPLENLFWSYTSYRVVLMPRTSFLRWFKALPQPGHCASIPLYKILHHCLNVVWAVHVYLLTVAVIGKSNFLFVVAYGPCKGEPASCSPFFSGSGRPLTKLMVLRFGLHPFLLRWTLLYFSASVNCLKDLQGCNLVFCSHIS